MLFGSKRETFGSNVSTIILMIVLSFDFCLLSSQVPQGFNYQAIARDGSGNPITGLINVKIAILSSTDDADVIWEEEHTGVDPDDHGLFSIVVGQGTHVQGLATFSLIDWTVTPLYIRTKINDVKLGTTQLWSVPYAMVADSLGGPLNKLKVTGAATSSDEEALFEVRNKGGKSVFAVYNDGVSIHVDKRTKGAKGGFSVGGFEAGGKDVPGQKYLFADAAGVNIYIDDNPLKGAKGGFSVGGFESGKGTANFLDVSYDYSGTVIDPVNRILWYPQKNAFLSGNIKILSSGDVGENSLASGYQAKAKGQYSQSMGYLTQALGNYSTAIGKNAVANMENSFAFGDGAKAQNQDSYAFGAFAEAQGLGSFAFGSVGRDSLGPTGSITKAVGNYSFAIGLGAQAGAAAEGAFAIGSGTNALGKFSLAMGYQSSASDYYSVAIGRLSQASKSSVAIGSSAYSSGDYSLALYGKATGYKSINIGSNSTASGSHSIAIGGYFTSTPVIIINRTEAQGLRSVAIGNGIGALGVWSVAIGNGTYGALVVPPAITYGKAVADYSYVIGTNNISDGNSAFAIGNSSTSTGSNSFAIGTDVTTTGSYSFGLGRDVTSSGNYSFALGTNVTSSGVYATATGRYTTAQAYNSFVIGRYNVIEGTTDSWSQFEPLFVIGNGSSTSARSNAFSVRKDGLTVSSGTIRATGFTVPTTVTGAAVEIFYFGGGVLRAYDPAAGGTLLPLSIYSGVITPITDNSYDLGSSTNRWKSVWAIDGTINTSDRRLKDNIQPLSGSLKTVLDLNPVSFTWKNQSYGTKHIGLIAQEVIPLIPEVVVTGDDPDKTLGINYAGIVPVLINAIQEQQKQIDELRSLVNKLISEKK